MVGRLNRWLFGVALIIGGVDSHAQGWTVTEATTTARARWMATVTSASGNKLRMWREIVKTKFQAFAQLELEKGQFGDQPPQYRIDQEMWRNLDTPVGRTAKLEAERVTWMVWSGMTQDIGADDALQNWIKGATVTFQWTDKKGRIQEDTFSLAGAGEAIQRVVSGTYR